MNAQQFGARLVQLREQRAISAAQLARLSSVDYMQVRRYERGETLPSLITAARLAKVLQITLDELVTGSGPAAPPAFQNTDLLDRMLALDTLPQERQQMALRVLDTVIAGHELETLSDRLRR